MTRKEIRALRDKVSTDPILTDEEIEYIWMAMDNQEPMKPVNTGETYDNQGETLYEYKCSACEGYITVGGITRYKPNYCENCGQKLDWEDEE